MDLTYLKAFVKNKKILHTTHVNPDCDGIASIYWGLMLFGGNYYLPEIILRTSKGLAQKLNLNDKKDIDFESYDLYFIYDTEKREYVDFLPEEKPYILFDHHHMRDQQFIKKALNTYIIESSANVVNLYELSLKHNITLNDDVLFSFAVALYTDTIMFKTARKKEFHYFADFLSKHKFEEITDTIYAKPIDHEKFKKVVKDLRIISINNLRVGISEFENEVLFYSFIEGLFDVLSIDVLIGILPPGIKIHMKKKHIQKIYHKLLIPLQKDLGIIRFQGFWYGFYNYQKIIKALEKYEN
ncbi:MAG: phosphoesterase [Thermosipho sp. (in: Bacteria)]|nr:phosphoesterase [Thermosipho sp. (in: thermotogales)]